MWITINVTGYHRTQPAFDSQDPGFGRGIGVYTILAVGVQLNYILAMFLIG